MKRRVVVTGLGAISPVGNDVATTWRSLVEGRSGSAPITKFDASNFPVRFAPLVATPGGANGPAQKCTPEPTFRQVPDLRSMTGGRAAFTMHFSHYEEVPSHLADKIIAAAQQEKEEARK